MDSMKSDFLGLDGARDAARLYDLGHEAATREIQDRWDENLRAGKRTPLFSNTGIITPESIEPGITVLQTFFLAADALPPGFYLTLTIYRDQITIAPLYQQPAFHLAVIRRLLSEIDKILPGFEEFTRTNDQI